MGALFFGIGCTWDPSVSYKNILRQNASDLDHAAAACPSGVPDVQVLWYADLAYAPGIPISPAISSQQPSCR
jgi:hypothetical protein